MVRGYRLTVFIFLGLAIVVLPGTGIFVYAQSTLNASSVGQCGQMMGMMGMMRDSGMTRAQCMTMMSQQGMSECKSMMTSGDMTQCQAMMQ